MEQWLRDFAQGEAGHKNRELPSFTQRKLLYLKHNVANFKPKGTLKNNRNFGSKQLVGD